MKMEKLCFKFTLLPGTDEKSNIHCITSITTSENKVYVIPKELQSVVHHRELIKTAAFIKVKNSLKKFRLIQDENLNITQKQEIVEEKEEKVSTNLKANADEEMRNNNNKDKYTINFNEHIKEEDFEVKMDYLNEYQKSEINKLINKYNSIFARNKYDVGTVNGYEARIDLLVDKYCSKRPYRCTMEDKKEIEEQVGKLLDSKLIEESYSPFAAPVTLAFKKEDNKKSRLCIDFRDLNKIVVPEAQPFPLIEDLVTKAKNCKYYTTLDINSAFWSIPLRIEDRNKTGFVTQDGHFQNS